MNKLNLKWRVRAVTGLMWLLVVGLDAAAAIIAVNRDKPVVLIPFAIATLVSLGAVWWAQRCNGEVIASPPFSGEKSRRIALTHTEQNWQTGPINRSSRVGAGGRRGDRLVDSDHRLI